MKYLVLFACLLVALTTTEAQQYTITAQDENYYLRYTETAENGTGRNDTVVTIKYLGDTSNYVQAIRNLDTRNSNEYVRLLRRLQELNQSTRDNSLRIAAAGVGVNLDSLNDRAYSPQLFVDTMSLIIYTSRLTAAELLEWTILPSPPNIIREDVVTQLRPGNIVRLKTSLATTHRLIMEGPDMFRLIAFPGTVSFYVERENEHFVLWRSENIGLPKMRILSYKQPRLQKSGDGGGKLLKQ